MEAAPLSRTTSLFLDLLRLAAAGTVFAYHVGLLWYGLAGGRMADAGHRAVVVFFVLSGFVIAYATFRRESNPRDYVLARLSRLYSVVLPALVLTAGLQFFGGRLNPGFYLAFERGHDLLRYAATAFFVQSLWRFNLSPPTDGPFWSLGYEFWYYAVFGVAVFVRPWRMKIAAVIALLAASGIDSLLLMPSWILGVLLYLRGRCWTLSRAGGVAAVLLLVAAALAAVLTLPNWPRTWGRPPWWHSSSFLTDGLLGILLAALIGAFDAAFRTGRISARLDAAIRWAADHTFSLYLYHYPLLLFCAAVVPFNRHDPSQGTAMVLGVLAVIVALSVATESARPLWRRLFGAAWDFAGRRLAARIAPQRAGGQPQAESGP